MTLLLGNNYGPNSILMGNNFEPRHIDKLDNFLAELDKIERSIKELKSRIDDDVLFQKYSIKSDDIIKLEIKNERILNLKESFLEKAEFNKKIKDKIDLIVLKRNEKIKEYQENMDLKEKEYQNYLKQKKEWEDKQKGIKGEKNKNETIEYYEYKLKYIDIELQKKLDKFQKERIQIFKNVIECYLEKQDKLEEIYKYAQDIAIKQSQKFNIPINEFIEFNADIKFALNFNDQFSNFINHNRTGTFYRTDKGNEELNKLKNEIKFNEINSMVEFPLKIVEALNHNLAVDPSGEDPNYNTNIEDQLLTKKLDFYNYLFSGEYFQVQFSITYDRKNISLLSPGEKGILLLIFYLLIDKDKRPILIDQPEENLDNETVYRRLVSFIRKAKKERQIIIITHNPNLAIVCDAEQIIHAKMDKEKNHLISYITGSIENKEMKENALNILEGTRPAFTNRKIKYDIE